MVEDNFDTEYENDLLINNGIVSVLLAKYDSVSEVSETEEDYIQDKAENQKSLCYYFMNNGVVNEQHSIFKKPGTGMMYHLKPLFTKVKVDNMPVNNVFIDGGATANLMSCYLFKKRGKTNVDL